VAPTDTNQTIFHFYPPYPVNEKQEAMWKLDNDRRRVPCAYDLPQPGPGHDYTFNVTYEVGVWRLTKVTFRLPIDESTWDVYDFPIPEGGAAPEWNDVPTKFNGGTVQITDIDAYKVTVRVTNTNDGSKEIPIGIRLTVSNTSIPVSFTSPDSQVVLEPCTSTNLNFTYMNHHQAKWRIEDDRRRVPYPPAVPAPSPPPSYTYTYRHEETSNFPSQWRFTKVTLRLPIDESTWKVHDYTINYSYAPPFTMEAVPITDSKQVTLGTVKITNFTHDRVTVQVTNTNFGKVTLNGSKEIPIGLLLTVSGPNPTNPNELVSFTSPDPQIILEPRPT